MSVISDCNSTPVSSCMYSTVWPEKNSWTEDFYSGAQITAPAGHEIIDDESREKNRKSRGYKHVPHKDKPAPVVARRNARERKRVQAVNTAFARLRKAVPIENSRGKRISKVKTLQYAIDYIQNLERVLVEEDESKNLYHFCSESCYCCHSYKTHKDIFDDALGLEC